VEQNADFQKPVSLLSSKILSSRHPSAQILAHGLVVVGRQVELMNVFLGFEQQNKYTIRDVHGSQIGWIIEEDKGLMGAILRQLLRTRREFKADVTDIQGNLLLKIHRPIKWFLNSTISVSKPDGTEIGMVRSDWHLWRRRYDLFIENNQIARIDSGFWAWDFAIEDEQTTVMAFVTRKFVGFMKELFTDMGQYVVHFDSVCQKKGLSLDERSVFLASAISIDIDYFSRHSTHSGGGFFFTTPSE
jgi:uncharacterized protein YxjI